MRICCSPSIRQPQMRSIAPPSLLKRLLISDIFFFYSFETLPCFITFFVCLTYLSGYSVLQSAPMHRVSAQPSLYRCNMPYENIQGIQRNHLELIPGHTLMPCCKMPLHPPQEPLEKYKMFLTDATQENPNYNEFVIEQIHVSLIDSHIRRLI